MKKRIFIMTDVIPYIDNARSWLSDNLKILQDDGNTIEDVKIVPCREQSKSYLVTIIYSYQNS